MLSCRPLASLQLWCLQLMCFGLWLLCPAQNCRSGRVPGCAECTTTAPQNSVSQKESARTLPSLPAFQGPLLWVRAPLRAAMVGMFTVLLVVLYNTCQCKCREAHWIMQAHTGACTLQYARYSCLEASHTLPAAGLSGQRSCGALVLCA